MCSENCVRTPVVNSVRIKHSFHSAALDNCTANGSLRLVNGTTDSEGMVEICINGTYGLVCDDRWDILDALVVCRQLNFTNSMCVRVCICACMTLCVCGCGCGCVHCTYMRACLCACM